MQLGRRLHHALAVVGAVAALALTASPASAFEMVVSGQGTVSAQSVQETMPSLLCAGSRTDAVHCVREYGLYQPPCPAGRACAAALRPPSLHLIATAAAGWSFAGYGDPPVDPATLETDVSSSRTQLATFVDPPPVVTLTAPESSTGIAPLVATAADDTAVTSVAIDVIGPDGSTVAHLAKAGAVISLPWQADGALPGRYIVTATAVDEGGMSTSASRALIVPQPVKAVAATSETSSSSGNTAQTLGVTPTVGSASFRYRWGSKTEGSKTTITDLVIHSVSAGATLTIACTGHGCPPKLRLVKRGSGLVGASLIGRTLRRDVTVEVRASAFGKQSYVVRWQLRAGRGPLISRWCTAVNSDRQVACAA